MVNGLVVLLTMLAPLLAVVLLLELAEWRDRRRQAALVRQIALTDAIAAELGGIVAPLVESSLRGPWRVRIAVPFSRPVQVGRIVTIAQRVLARVPGRHEIVLTAQEEPPRGTPRGASLTLVAATPPRAA